MDMIDIQDRACMNWDEILKARVLLGQLIEKMGYCKSLFEDVEALVFNAEQHSEKLKQEIGALRNNKN